MLAYFARCNLFWLLGIRNGAMWNLTWICDDILVVSANELYYSCDKAFMCLIFSGRICLLLAVILDGKKMCLHTWLAKKVVLQHVPRADNSRMAQIWQV